MSKKQCTKCLNWHIKKDGFMRNKQRYRCCSCGYVFQNKSRKNTQASKKLWEDYAVHKQTYSELAEKNGCSERTIQTRLDAYNPWYEVNWNISSVKPPPVLATPIILLIDTTYFSHDFGVMVFRSSLTKETLCTMIVHYEMIDQYKEVVRKIQEVWWNVLAIVCDGKRGLLGWFGNIPTQMCQFHQVAIVLRATTKRPKTEANQELKHLAHLLTKTDKETFTYALEQYHKKWWEYLKEKTLLASGRTVYTHKRTRSAVFSLQRNLHYLFTWYDYLWQIDIPNTTNWLEGIFGHLKAKVSLHRGLKRTRKLKLILTLLHSKNPSSQPHTFFH